jgi:hypothetical protein
MTGTSSTQTTVRDVLARDLGQKIESVVKVYDKSHLAEDLRDFVITDSLAKEMRKFLGDFTGSLRTRIQGGDAGDGMAVWLWGFFGSGKSHVAKVLGYLLQNGVVDASDGSHAIDLFSRHLEDPSLPGANDLRGDLLQIREHAWCQTIAFEIKSQLDMANPDSVTEICLRTFYQSLGLSGTVWLARLERKLQKDGRYDAFVEAYRDKNLREWSADREEHGYYLEEIKEALASARESSVGAAADLLVAYQRDHSDVTPAGAAKEFADYLDDCKAEVTPREPHLIFVVDEMGQFVGDSSDKIEELRAIIEQCGVQAGGRVWFICTSQEALDQVLDRAGLKLAALGKLDARFSTKMKLTSEDVQRVVEERLLRKREAEESKLRELYTQREGAIADLCGLNLERVLTTVDRDRFIKAYPFLPMTMPLVQELFTAMRGFKLSGGERSMIDVAQGSLAALADRPLGAVVPLDMVFDQETDELSASDYLGTAGIKMINDSDKQVPDTPVPASSVLKALWLISRVEWVPKTPEAIARLLAPSLDTDVPALRSGVETTLKRLHESGMVGRDEATGQYKYLSEAERGVEADISDAISTYGVGVAKRRAMELLKTRVLTGGNLHSFKTPFGKKSAVSFSVKLDDEVLSGTGEIALEITSPLGASSVDAVEQANLAAGAKGRTIWWLAASQSLEDLTAMLKRIEALDRVPQQDKWRNERSDETVRILKDKEKERAGLERNATRKLEEALKTGVIYASGDGRDLDGSRDVRDIVQDCVVGVAEHLFTMFTMADRDFEEKNIPAYLRPATSKPQSLDPDLELFDANGHLNGNGALVSTAFDVLKVRKDQDQPVDGKAIVDLFAAIPYGWPNPLVRIVLAAMFRGGAIYLQTPDSDRPIYELGTPGVEALFTATHKFNKARFNPAIGGLTPDEVKSARDLLIGLGESSVPDTTHGLADRVSQVGARLKTSAFRVGDRVKLTALPVPDTHRTVEAMVDASVSLADPSARVRQFVDDVEQWREAVTFLQEYDNFIEAKLDARFADYKAIVAFSRLAPEVLQGEKGQAAKARVDDWDAVVAGRDVVSRWKVLAEAADAVVARYRAVYGEALLKCRDAIAQLRTGVEGSPEFLELDLQRRNKVIEQFFGVSGSLGGFEGVDISTVAGLRAASETRKLVDLHTLLVALPGYRTATVQVMERELEDQGSVLGEAPVKKKTARVQVTGRLGSKRIVRAEEFDALWSDLGAELRAEVKSKLADSDDVLLEG